MKVFFASICFVLFSMTNTAHAQNYDLYAAKSGSPKKPILIFVHGGAWLGGAASQYKSLGEALSKRGLCVAVIDYHLAPAFKHPIPVEDLDHVIEKIKSDKPIGCDTSKFILSGHSAGAHMIAFWATTHSDSSVRGFIGIEGIYDIPALVTKWPNYREQFVSAEFGEDANWKSASPALLTIKSRAPWLVLHSTKDELVDVAQSSEFQKHLVNGGVHADLTVLPGGTHFGVIEALEVKSSAASLAFDKFVSSLK